MRKKTLLPITLMCVLALVGCGGNKQSSSSPSQSAQPSSVPSSSQPVASSSSNEPAPVSSSSEEPSTAPESSSEAGPESSEDPTTYGVAINNKDEFADWHAGDANITLDITLTPEANVRMALMNEELVITSSDESKVSVSGLVLTAQEAGKVTITATYHGQSDSVEVDVKAEDIKTISDIIANGKKDDKITFKGYYLGHSTRMNYLGSNTYPYVYVGDGTRSIIVYCMAASLLEGIEVGDIVKVTGTYSPYGGLPETSSGSVTKFSKSSGEGLVRPPVININSENPTVALSADNLGSPVHVSGAEVTKIVLKEAKSRTDLEPAVNGQAVTTNYYERTFKIKVGETEYTLFSNERYDGEIADITELSVGDTVSFDGFVNIKENAYNLAMLSNVTRVASEKDPVESVSIKGNNKVYAGKSLTLEAEVLPETALQNVTWASSNQAVATIDSNGVVTGVSAGKTTITVTSVGQPEKTASLEVTVLAPITEPVHAGTEADPFTADDAVVYTAALQKSDKDHKYYSDREIYVEGKVVDSKFNGTYGNFDYIWLEDATGNKAFELYQASLDSNIFSEELRNYYAENQTVDGKSIGNLVGHTVKAHGYAQNYNGTLELTPNTPAGGTKVSPLVYEVSKSQATAVSISETLNLAVGGQETLTATATPIDGDLSSLVWISSDPAVATVENGLVSGVGAGTAVITAKISDTVKATCTATVIAGGVAATSVALNKDAATISMVQSETLTATVLPENTTDSLSWSSSNPEVATVADGVVTPLKAGTTTITATAGNFQDECVITVTQPALADFNSAVKGNKVDFYAYYVGKYNNAKGYFVSDGSVGAYIYENAPDGVVAGDILHVSGEIDVYNGLREIVKVTATKVASYEGLTNPVTMNIDEAAISAFTVSDQGRKATITGTVTNIGGTPEAGKNSVNYTITVGSKTIPVYLHKTNVTTAEYNDFADKAKLNKTVTIEAYVAANKSKVTDLTTLTAADYQLVNPKVTNVQEAAPLTGITLNKTTVNLEVGGSQPLVASPVPGDADLGTVLWSSSDEAVATVDNNGNVTAVAAGTATITAKVTDEIKATCTVTVTAPLTYTVLETLDFVSELTAYKAYDETEMNAFIKGSSSLGAENTNFVSHDKTGAATNPLIGANGTISSVDWSDYNCLKLGSTSKNCTIKLTFKDNLTIGKVVIKAAGWPGKTCKLQVNGGTVQSIKSGTAASAYNDGSVYQEYTFTFEGTNEITFQTTLAVCISEIVIYTVA